MKQLILLLLCILLYNGTVAGNEIDSLLVQLEHTMAERKQYDAAKKLRIKSIKELLQEPGISIEQTYHVNNLIIREFEAYAFDSTLHYIELNLLISGELENTALLNETKLKLSGLLASSGRYKEAIDILNKINRNELSNELINDYYTNYGKVYDELSFYTPVKENQTEYTRLYKAYIDSLLSLLDPNSEEYLFIIEKQFRDTKQLIECRKVNSKRLAMAQMGTRIYSIITFQRAISYELELNCELEKKFLILSAISDIKASVKDNASLTKLALLLYEEKKIDKAHDYINFSFEDAVFFNSRLRFIEISNILPVINEAFQFKSDQQKANLRTFLIIISILSVILFFAALYIYMQMKNLSHARNDLQKANKQLKDLNINLHHANAELNDLNNELSESNHVKEQYIGNFLSICSNYIYKLDIYRKMVNKHIAARRVAELYEITKSKQLIEKELIEFYENFDNTFLNIYPNFVEELNSLLLVKERITLKKGELLNTELRIFALIRLGISDSSKIAKLLRYSVNTIYNYRVKIKNKAAIPRDDFEVFVMKIDAFSK